MPCAAAVLIAASVRAGPPRDALVSFQTFGEPRRCCPTARVPSSAVFVEDAEVSCVAAFPAGIKALRRL